MELPTEVLKMLKKAGFKVEYFKIIGFTPGYVQGYLTTIANKYPSTGNLEKIAKIISRVASKHWIIERITDNIFGLINSINMRRLDIDYIGEGIMVLCKKENLNRNG